MKSLDPDSFHKFLSMFTVFQKVLPTPVLSLFNSHRDDYSYHQYSIKSVSLASISCFLLKFTLKPFILTKSVVAKTFSVSVSQLAHFEILMFFSQFLILISFHQQIVKHSPKFLINMTIIASSFGLILSGLLFGLAVFKTQNSVNSMLLTVPLFMTFILTNLLTPISTFGVINVFRNHLSDKPRIKYSSFLTSPGFLGAVCSSFLVSYLMIFRSWTSVFTSIGVFQIGIGIFVILNLDDDNVLDEMWEGATSNAEAVGISAGNSQNHEVHENNMTKTQNSSSENIVLKTLSRNTAFTRNVTFTRDLDFDISFGGENDDCRWVFSRKNIFQNWNELIMTFKTVGVMELAIGHLSTSCADTMFSVWLAYFLVQESGFSVWNAGYVVMFYELGGIFGTSVLIPIIQNLMDRSHQKNNVLPTQKTLSKLLFPLKISLILGSVCICFHKYSNFSNLVYSNQLFLQIFVIGTFISSVNSEIYVSEICNSFMMIYDSKLKNRTIPGFRTVETVVLASGYLGRAVAVVLLSVFHQKYPEKMLEFFVGIMVLFGSLGAMFYGRAEKRMKTL